ncbi:hypothetical protein L1987_28375 [Smallanthus sonchifolius]|uniref:Uncharacterized protein n=1 Tax=Smallanthus sonchifolius TaxID=185202 RepID=A0ACB9HWC7_9ASTR|nr:hypothetical protein L1987_28375 [Smallanthus sonchifolius]
MEANRKRTDSFHDALLKNEFIAQPEISTGNGDYEFLNLNQDLGDKDCSMINGVLEDIQLTSEIKDDTINGVSELVLLIKPMVITGEQVEKACNLYT